MCDQQRHHPITGKTIASVSSDTMNPERVFMADRVEIRFTDGSRLVLKTDWYGHDCYISEPSDGS